MLDIYRKSIGDSALFWYEWGLLTGKEKRGYACMNTNTLGNKTTGDFSVEYKVAQSNEILLKLQYGSDYSACKNLTYTYKHG